MSQDPLGKPGFRVARQELSYSRQQTLLSQTKLNIIFAIFAIIAGANMLISSAAQSILCTGGGLAMLLRYSIGDSWHDMIFKTNYLFSEGSPHVHVNFKIGYFLFSKQSFFGRKKNQVGQWWYSSSRDSQPCLLEIEEQGWI